MKSKLMIAAAAAAAIAVGLGAGSFAWFTSTATSANNTFAVGTLSINRANGQTDTWYQTDGTTTSTISNLQCSDQRVYKFTINNLKDKTKEDSYSSLDLLYKANFADLAKVTGAYDSATKNIFSDSTTHNDSTLITATNSKNADLLNGLLFDVVVTRTGDNSGFVQAIQDTTANKADVNSDNTQITYHDLNLDELQTLFSTPRKMKGGAKVVDEYVVTATLPNQIFGGATTGTDSKLCSSNMAGKSLIATTTNDLAEDNDYQGAAGAFKINVYAAQNVDGAAFSSTDATIGNASHQQ